MKIYIPPQIKRLAFFFVIFVGLFILVRWMLVPESFGDYGHYRANSLIDNAAFENHYAGQESCMACHQDVAELKDYDLHSDLTCETCHGPGQAHVNAPETVDVLLPSGREFCGLCHSLNAARPSRYINQVDLSDHNTDRDCMYCHNAHQPWELANQ